jgi:hypothetical protein
MQRIVVPIVTWEKDPLPQILTVIILHSSGTILKFQPI